MRPVRPTAVHKTDRLAELVCSNSFRGDKLDNAVGLLKEEMRRLGSLVMRAADASRVPAGAALAVDRERFSQAITEADRSRIRSSPSTREEIAAHSRRSDDVSADHRDRPADLRRAVARTSPRSSAASTSISTTPSARSSSPRSIDMSKVFRASRWGRSLSDRDQDQTERPDRTVRLTGSAGAPACGVDDGEGDYLNCPMTKDEYDRFYDALVAAESATVHDFDKEKFFEGCLPIEVMAHRGATRCASGR